jgi:hypothetical protein
LPLAPDHANISSRSVVCISPKAASCRELAIPNAGVPLAFPFRFL